MPSPSQPAARAGRFASLAASFSQLTTYNRPLDLHRRLSFRIRHNGVIFGKGRPGPVEVEVYLEHRPSANEIFGASRRIDERQYEAGGFTFTVLTHWANQLQRQYAAAE